MKKSRLIKWLIWTMVLLGIALLFTMWRTSYRQTRQFVNGCKNDPQIQEIIAEVGQRAQIYLSSLPYKNDESKTVFDLPDTLGNNEMMEELSNALQGLDEAMNTEEVKARILVILRENYDKMTEKERRLIGEKAILQAYEEITPQIAELYKEAEKQISLKIGYSQD